jgi:steroid delta-isomerase-like uncharacterized protein
MTNTDINHVAPTATSSDVVRRFVDDVLNHGRFDALTEIIHPDYRYEGPDGAQLHGLDELQMLVAGYHAGFSDFHVAITSEMTDGDLVAMTMMLTGTHDGEFDGIPATGERLSLPLAVFTRIEDGRIVEDREFYDTGTMLAQLGLGGGQAG